MKLVQTFLSRLPLRLRVPMGEGSIARGRIWFHGPGTLRVGRRVTLDATLGPIELYVRKHGEIVLEDDVVVEGGTSIEASKSVRVGPRVRVGAFCKIMDNNAHQTTGDRHSEPPSVPVVLEEDVIVEPRSILLPGAYLERGVLVREGTVITRRVPAGARVAGVPAVIQRS